MTSNCCLFRKVIVKVDAARWQVIYRVAPAGSGAVTVVGCVEAVVEDQVELPALASDIRPVQIDTEGGAPFGVLTRSRDGSSERQVWPILTEVVPKGDVLHWRGAEGSHGARGRLGVRWRVALLPDGHEREAGPWNVWDSLSKGLSQRSWGIVKIVEARHIWNKTRNSLSCCYF